MPPDFTPRSISLLCGVYLSRGRGPARMEPDISVAFDNGPGKWVIGRLKDWTIGDER